jgi:short-subunit dehydrogenase involved in D-alanine esterification of teichoic acids
MNITHNVVLITGGSSGIGLAFAKKFLGENNQVIIIGRSKTKLEAVKQQLPNIIIEAADITNEKYIDMLTDKYKNVNILVNNAGVHYEYNFKNEKEEIFQIRNEIETNFIAPILLSKKFIPVLSIQRESAIINITSYFGISPKPSAPIYSATKAAMRSFTKSLRMQLMNTNIKVFDVAPPIIDTPMTANSNTSIKKMKTDELIEIIWKALKNDQYEIYPGLSKLFYILNRLHPQYLEKKVMTITSKEH